MQIDMVTGERVPQHVAWEARSFAKQLAGYISDPSTIRVNTIREFGFGPSIELARDYISRARKTSAAHDYGEPIGEPDFRIKALPQTLCDKPCRAMIYTPLTAGEAITQVAEVFGMTYEQLRGSRGNRSVINVRHLAIQLLYARAIAKERSSGLLASISQIGGWVNRDHSTAMHSLRKFNEMRLRRDDAAVEIMNTYGEFLEEWGLEDVIYSPGAKPTPG